MTESLFFLGPDNVPRLMTPSGFLSENQFQSLIESHPDLLTDSDFGEGSPRRWVLVKREAGVTDRADGSDRWSLDHLFLDQSGVPTLVEIKRASDTRARREVVAQMLDYAANSVSWWKIDDIRDWFAETCKQRGEDINIRLSALLDTDDVDEDGFWRQVEANLRSGRVRMLFIADQISAELQRIVEFLNEQMNPATVAALELRLYSDGSGKILAPRIFGTTQRAALAKGVSRSVKSEKVEEWLEATEKDANERLNRAFEIARSMEFRLIVASQSVAADIKAPHTRKTFDWVRALYFRRSGLITFGFYMLHYGVNTNSPEARTSIANELKAIGFNLPVSLDRVISGEPTFPLPSLGDVVGWERVERAMRLVRDRITEKNSGQTP